MPGEWRTKRSPTRIASSSFSRGRLLRRRSRCQWRRKAALTGNDAAKRAKVNAGPPTTTSTPPSAGPRERATLKPMPFSAMAGTRSLRGTISGTVAPQAGWYMAVPMPMAKVRAISPAAPIIPW